MSKLTPRQRAVALALIASDNCATEGTLAALGDLRTVRTMARTGLANRLVCTLPGIGPVTLYQLTTEGARAITDDLGVTLGRKTLRSLRTLPADAERLEKRINSAAAAIKHAPAPSAMPDPAEERRALRKPLESVP